MFLLSQGAVQALIIIGAVILFLVTFILNRRTKAPKGVDVPEECASCAASSCIVKLSNFEKMKDEINEQIKDCDGEKQNEAQ